MSSIHLCHNTVLQPCCRPPSGETQDGEKEGDRCVGTWHVSGMLTWQCCDHSIQVSCGSDFSHASCLFQDVNHYRVPYRNRCQSQEILQFSKLLYFKFFWGFVLFSSLGVETELSSVNEAVFYFFPYDSYTASGHDHIKSSKLSNIWAGQCLGGWPPARIQMVKQHQISVLFWHDGTESYLQPSDMILRSCSDCSQPWVIPLRFSQAQESHYGSSSELKHFAPTEHQRKGWAQVQNNTGSGLLFLVRSSRSAEVAESGKCNLDCFRNFLFLFLA